MADVILREYVEQLRAHVQARRLSDAFTLGQHILRYYPKHIETYVILAQASLEADDLAGATDLFRRVLSADPENVLALAGMALIHETQERNDEALWYLERAYEIQPSNDELRREVVRLRELYYGTTNERLELTPGALARIYARQGQYAPAVNEFRKLLRHESKRYDARVALAETLFRAGRADEAAQLAQTIMQDAPYSLKPNLILGTLWTDNSVTEGQTYLARAQALDPEHRVARDLIGARFADMPPPRLPSLQDQTGSRWDDQTIGLAYSEPPAPDTTADRDATDAADMFVAPPDMEEKLRAAEEAEQAARAETRAQETSDLPFAAGAAGAIAAAEIINARETEQAPVLTETENTDATLAAIAAAEQQQAVAAPSAPRARSKFDAIPADAIAAAAAALATSIAVDKLKQPAPARRTHPALPKVRPVISGASEKLPAWLRLGATPAQASASFDAPAPNQAERIEPIVTPETQTTPDNRPDWLVEAQAPTPGAPTADADADLPEWLKTAAVLNQAEKPGAPEPAAAKETAPPLQATTAPAEAALPEWLRPPREPGQAETVAPMTESAPPTSAANETATRIQAEPDAALPTAAIVGAVAAQAFISETESSAPVTEATPASVAESDATAHAAPEAADSFVAPAPEPAAAPVEKPLDARALIDAARVKRENGDFKGALDSYERAMHRRPNHLDEIIGDLQTLVQQPDTPPTAHRLLGEAYAMAGRFKESLEQYRRAMGK